jgi:hypothetical protein
MTHIKTLFILLIILFIVLYLSKHNEHYAGALIQLYSRGPQDRYLTNDDHIYYNPYNPYLYNPVYPYNGYDGYYRPRYFWNEPTRFRKNDAPYLLLTPDRYYLG